jgi:O-antigen ligase
MLEFFSLYLIITIILCFVKLRLGISMYLMYQILVPKLNIEVGSFEFSYNLMNSLILIAFFLQYQNRMKDIQLKPFIPFIFLFFSQLLLIPFHFSNMTFSEQFNLFRVDIMGTLFLPLVMLNLFNFDSKAYKLFFNILLISIVVVVLYGLFLISTPGINPWLIFTLPMFGGEFDDLYASAENGRMFGRLSSVFIHPMTYGLFLSLSVVFVLFLLGKRKNKFFSVAFLLIILLAILFCGIRTPILTVSIIFAIYFVRNLKLKTIFMASSLMLLTSFLISMSPELLDYLSSITDSESANVSGSSISMRTDQFFGCLKIIKENPFFGMGYGWCSVYIQKFGDHPVVFAFESLIYVILCNNGYFGVFLWSIFIYLYIRFVSENHIGNNEYLILLMLTYIGYSLITGEYNYMKYFLLFYPFLFHENINNEQYIKKLKNEKQS